MLMEKERAIDPLTITAMNRLEAAGKGEPKKKPHAIPFKTIRNIKDYVGRLRKDPKKEDQM